MTATLAYAYITDAREMPEYYNTPYGRTDKPLFLISRASAIRTELIPAFRAGYLGYIYVSSTCKKLRRFLAESPK